MDGGPFDIAIVGGGIVGLAATLALIVRRPGLRLIVLEKERAPGMHQTTHNSGVIHTGIYYRPGSHKARLCVEGARLMHEFCAEHRIRLERCGKVIVATDEREVPGLQTLYERGIANGVAGLQMIGPERLREVEPHAAGLRAIYSPGTAIVDFGEVARAMADAIQAAGVHLATGAKVSRIVPTPDGWHLHTGRGIIEARRFINCAGLYSDVIAQMAGIDPEIRIVPFRGEYYLLKPERRHLVRGLIYPVADPAFPFLGVHLTRTVHGEVEAGPNAVLAFAREGYTLGRVRPGELLATLTYPGVWRMAQRYWRTGLHEFARSLSTRGFVAAVRRLVPELTAADVVKGGAGVRAQAVTPDGFLFDDFRIVEGPRAIHVLNAPSPAATASLAIGGHIAALATSAFGR
jgi:L-2-hydroxyglutarate oxidase